MQRTPRFLYYAFGGGMGHGMRTIALARQLAHCLGGRHRILLNSPCAEVLRALARADPQVEVCVLPAAADTTAAKTFIQQAVHTFPPDVFVVDTFPRGLGGELASLEGAWPGRCSVLISRTLPAVYVHSYDLECFTARHYQMVIAPGEDSPLARQSHIYRTAPFLIRHAYELPSRRQAAQMLEVHEDTPAILVVASGTLWECQEAQRITHAIAQWRFSETYALRLAVPHPDVLSEFPHAIRLVRHVPLLDCLPAVRLVIGAGGYNLLHETAALHVPALFWPRPRKYDDQFRRVAAHRWTTSLAALRQLMHRELTRPFPYTGLPSYPNGVVQATALIATMMHEKMADLFPAAPLDTERGP